MVAILLFLFTVTTVTSAISDGSFEIRMPSVRPQKDDLTLCYARRIDDSIFLTGFNPIANMSINHHMIVYGCGEYQAEQGPSLDRVWDCGEMNSGGEDDDNGGDFEKGAICVDGQPPTIVYAWAMGAPSFSLPDGVSYQIGTKKVRYLVLQQHYKDTTIFKQPNKATDRGGVSFTTTPKPTPRSAGIFLLASGDGELAPESVSNFEIACRLSQPRHLRMHPFAYRVHSHTHGVVISGYRIRDGQWTEIGRQSPTLPQTFYNVTNPSIDIKRNDILAARCTMSNKDDKPVVIGPTQFDEMCNFYVYYYTENGVKPPLAFCSNPGPPNWSWEDFDDGDLNLSEMPDTVSEVPPPPPGVVPMDHGHHMKMASTDNENNKQNDKITAEANNNKDGAWLNNYREVDIDTNDEDGDENYYDRDYAYSKRSDDDDDDWLLRH